MMTSLLPLCKRHLNGAFVVFIKRSPPLAGFFMPEKRHRALNALVVANTGLSACWLFRQELLVCHVNLKREKDMLKQQDMTETARVV
ncbi:hypothetical protein ACTHH3_004852, partial [Escherichia coli]|nr:hypothetical protein [Escherichia coli]EEZ1994637.1 hypothetical protein [Escherichia coli]EHJ7322150.1 hypothetical protein [Escherichia coli]